MFSIEKPSLAFLDDVIELRVSVSRVNQVSSPRRAGNIADARFVLR
jgi:hypothetical protein